MDHKKIISANASILHGNMDTVSQSCSNGC